MCVGACTHIHSRYKTAYLSLRNAILRAVKRAAIIATGLLRKPNPTIEKKILRTKYTHAPNKER